jgi:drug/metabolite transporter (DMT)-like permease
VDLPAAAIAFYRVAIAGVVVVAGACLAGRSRSLAPGGHAWSLVALGAVLGAHWLLFFATIKLGSVALAALLVYTGPLFVAVLAPVLLGVRTTAATWAALAVGVAGVALVASEEGAIRASGEAVAAGLAAGLTFGLLLMGARRLAPRVTMVACVAWEMGAASALLLPLALAGPMRPPDAASLAGLLVLGVLSTAALGLVFVAVMRHVDAQTAGVLAFVEPVSSVVLAWIFLSQDPSARTLAGGALVLAAGLATVWLAPEPATARPEGGATLAP